MKTILGSIFLTLIAFFVPGNAQAASARCEGCSVTQFREMAKQFGVGQHIVTSFSTKQLMLFEVTDSSGGEPGVPPRIVVRSIAIPANIQQAFEEAHRFYIFSGRTMQAAITIVANDLDGVPGLKGATAYDVMSNFNLRSQLGDRLAAGPLPGWSQIDRAGEQLVQGVFGFFGAGDASLEIAVQMSDGSTVVFSVNQKSNTGQYQNDRSRTKNGQAIPEENAIRYTGTWLGTDQPALGNFVGGLGASVTYVGTGSGYGSMTCTWDGKTLQCRLQRK